MGRTRSTGGGSPAKKTGKTPARHTTPRKKSKTPSRKGKSPAKRGRSRSVSKSRVSPQKSTRKSPGRKSLSKSPSVKASTPKRGRRSRSRSQTSKASTRRTPSITQKVKDAAQVLEHKIASPIQSFASNLRSRRAAHDQALSRLGGPYSTSSSSRRQPIGQSLIQKVRNCHFANCFSGIRRRFRWPAVKRHVKKNWVRYLVLLATAAGAYYSYQNKKYLEKVVNEQYNKLADLIQQQKGSTFSKYFSGWFDESTTTQTPPTIPPRTVDQQQVPQPPHHSTQTGGK